MATDTTVINNLDGSVTISAAYLQDLQDAQFELSCLEAGGVDNWEWYSESLAEYWEMIEAREEAEEAAKASA
ncbi:hypothetical protein DSS3P8_165 [Roseobacter phage DSS3P8]|nr:hypothetical protein DSS3P8_165 [Roseobacter phage DSS3P8]